MSHFVECQTEFRDPQALVAALVECGFEEPQIEIHQDAVTARQRILVVDDLLATGGTCAAAGKLIERLGGDLVGFVFLVELGFLAGRGRLGASDIFSLLHYD